LIDAATALLRSGGPRAVTVDAVTSAANVARATLYRHFASGDDLLAAAVYSLVPRAPMPPKGGTLRDRLIALVHACAESFAETSVHLAVMSWPTVGTNTQVLVAPGTAGGRELHTLSECVAQQWAEPFDVIFSSPEAKAELGYVDRSQAVALLLGPIVLGILNMPVEFDYRACTRAAVDGFLATQAEKAKKRSAPDGL
jgi:AcrR family transcriptional regulator